MGFWVDDWVIFWSGTGRICTVFKSGGFLGWRLNYILVRDWKDLHCVQIRWVFGLITELYFGWGLAGFAQCSNLVGFLVDDWVIFWSGMGRINFWIDDWVIVWSGMGRICTVFKSGEFLVDDLVKFWSGIHKICTVFKSGVVLRLMIELYFG